MHRRMHATLGAITLAIALCTGAGTAAALPAVPPTTTPIKHIVVIFQENQSFDHYFGTYPKATNAPGEIPFTAAPGTPTVDGLTPALLTANPNAANPKRVAPSEMLSRLPCDNNHAYTAEQAAMNGGLMNKFIESTQGGSSACQPTAVMDYFDGNTVTGLWNYAQRYAMSDAHFGTMFGPSTIGAINLVSGTTRMPVDENGNPLADVAGTIAGGSAIGNRQPPASYDGCSSGGAGSSYAFDDGAGNQGNGTHKNIGDLLNGAGVSWGWFQGGFTPTSRTPDAGYPLAGKPTCGAKSAHSGGALVNDYLPHHNPFSYFKSTANPEHLPPTAEIGDTDQANHQYDLTHFTTALNAGKLPAVSFLKAAASKDGHPGYSDPVSEQRWLVDTVNKIQAASTWPQTAIFIAWDDSDGWYDHVYPQLVRGSSTSADVLNGPSSCGTGAGFVLPLAPGRCGFGPRMPLLALSPYAKRNHVDHTVSDQTSVTRFIEDNWSLGTLGGGAADADAASLAGMFDFASAPTTTPLVLDPETGALPGTARVPAPTPTPSPTPTSSPTPTATPIAAPAATTLGTVSCKAKRGKRNKVLVTCTGQRTPTVATTVAAKLTTGKGKRKRTLATGSGKVNGKTVAITLSPKRRLASGKYALTITVTPSQGAAQVLSIKL